MQYPDSIDNKIIDWLLQGDVSIRYQTYRDLWENEDKDLQNRIESEGWGAHYLALRNPNGYWGKGFYQPKWTSTHYSILDLRNLCISPYCQPIIDSIHYILDHHKSEDGGVNPAKTIVNSDVCINGMVLNYAAYFQLPEEKLTSIVDFILSQVMQDGGFNCWSNRQGAKHSSLHTTLSILEGIFEFEKNNYSYRLEELKKAEASSREFILMHRLYKSDRTGEIINKAFLRIPYPSRWKYDILRCMDYFQYAKVPFDERMQDAMDILISRRKNNGKWNLQAYYPGKRHFDMEEVGKPSRWNTLRMLRVLKRYQLHI